MSRYLQNKTGNDKPKTKTMTHSGPHKASVNVQERIKTSIKNMKNKHRLCGPAIREYVIV